MAAPPPSLPARLLAKWNDGLGCQEVTIRTDGSPATGASCSRTSRRGRKRAQLFLDEVTHSGDSTGQVTGPSHLAVSQGQRSLECKESHLVVVDVHHAAWVRYAGSDGLGVWRSASWPLQPPSRAMGSASGGLAAPWETFMRIERPFLGQGVGVDGCRVHMPQGSDNPGAHRPETTRVDVCAISQNREGCM